MPPNHPEYGLHPKMKGLKAVMLGTLDFQVGHGLPCFHIPEAFGASCGSIRCASVPQAHNAGKENIGKHSMEP